MDSPVVDILGEGTLPEQDSLAVHTLAGHTVAGRIAAEGTAAAVRIEACRRASQDSPPFFTEARWSRKGLCFCGF